MRLEGLVVVALAVPARADPAYYPRATAALGIDGFVGDVGALHPTGTAFTIAAEVEVVDSIAVRGVYEHGSLTASDDILVHPLDARVDVASLLVRHTLFSFGARETRLSGDMAALFGVAYDRYTFDGGGSVRRYEAVIGMESTAILSGSVANVLRFGFELMFSRAPDPGKLPLGCSGPCNDRTKTAPYDHTLMMEVSWAVGR